MGKGKEGMSEGEGEGAHTPPLPRGQKGSTVSNKSIEQRLSLSRS